MNVTRICNPCHLYTDCKSVLHPATETFAKRLYPRGNVLDFRKLGFGLIVDTTGIRIPLKQQSLHRPDRFSVCDI